MIRSIIKLFLLPVVVSLLFCSCAKTTAVEQVQTEALLWQIDKPGIQSSYLFGTVHIGKKGDKLPKNAVKMLDKCKALVTETDMLIDENSIELVLLASMMFDSASLSSKIGEDTFVKLAKEIDTYPPAVIDRLKPWAAFSMIAYSTPDGYSEDYGIDKLLTDYAIARGMKRLFLEEPMQTVQHFAEIPEDKLIEIIKDFVDNSEEYKLTTLRFMEMYKEGNIQGIIKYDKEISATYYEDEFWSSWMFQILDLRSLAWLDDIERHMGKQSTFIAVGAMHLFDENGLIEQLRHRGYTVSPVY